MKQLIQRWLGLEEIQARTRSATQTLNEIQRKQEAHLRQLKILYSGIGRIIAKVDPNYARDEINPERKAESDKLGAEAMKKLIAEHLARNPHE